MNPARKSGTEAHTIYYADLALTRGLLYGGAAVQARRVRALEAVKAARARGERSSLARPALVDGSQETGAPT